MQLANPEAAVFLLALYPHPGPAEGPVLATTAALALLQVLVGPGCTWVSPPRWPARGLRIAVSGR